MPRSKAKLTDKQERILVQCQLMGMTTADMVTISNRLKALDREKEFKTAVSEYCDDFTFIEKTPREFTITDREGKIYEVKVITDYSRKDWSYQSNHYADIYITKPGTRFKPRNIKKAKLPLLGDEIVAACPNGNKWLFRTMREIKYGRIS